MYTRFNLYIDGMELKRTLNVSEWRGGGTFDKNANVNPGSKIPVLLSDENGNIYMQQMSWGIALFKNRKPMHNARLESLTTKKSWLTLLQSNQRCVMPMCGFYVWDKTIIHGKFGKTRVEIQPYYITPRDDTLFYAAGLYRLERIPTGKRYCCTIITQPVDDQLKSYDVRVPRLLSHEQAQQWLNKYSKSYNLVQAKTRVQLCKPLPIGYWINYPNKYKTNEILRSKAEWDIEQEVEICGINSLDVTEYDRIVSEALLLNEQRKNQNSNSNSNSKEGEQSSRLNLKRKRESDISQTVPLNNNDIVKIKKRKLNPEPIANVTNTINQKKPESNDRPSELKINSPTRRKSFPA